MAIPRARQPVAAPTRISRPTAPGPRPNQSTTAIRRDTPSRDSSVRFAQNAALLQVLSNFCPPVADNSEETMTKDDTLVQVLAFLSAADAEPNNVTAVAVEELPATASPAAPLMRVHVAINKFEPKHNDDILHKIVSGFQGLFAILPRHKNSDPHRRRNELLNKIVSLCRDRILVRLAHPNKEKEGKGPQNYLGNRLEKAVHIIKHADTSQSSSVSSFLDRSAPVIQALRSLYETCPLDGDLVRVVNAVYRFKKSLGQEMEDVIHYWAAHEMNRMGRESLIRRINEMAFYKRCANFLCRLVRANEKSPPWLGRVDVVAVQPKEADFAPTRYYPDYSSLDRYLAQGSPSRLADALKRSLDSDFSVKDRFKTNCSKWLNHGHATIHAEIQIAHSLECNRSRNRGRSRQPIRPGAGLGPASKLVICASKHACYLCHAFFVAHNGFAEPPTHGKLYSGWRLPTGWQPSRFGHTSGDVIGRLNRFNAIMERDIDNILARLSKPGMLPTGNTQVLESPLFEMESSSSSLAATLAPVMDEEVPRPLPLLLTPPASPSAVRLEQAGMPPPSPSPPPPLFTATPPRSPSVTPLRPLNPPSPPEEAVFQPGTPRPRRFTTAQLDLHVVFASDDRDRPHALRLGKRKRRSTTASPTTARVRQLSTAEDSSVEEAPVKRASVEKASVKKAPVRKRSVLEVLDSISVKGNNWL